MSQGSAGVVERTCLRCGYDLRGLPAARCPECGLPFDPNAPLPAKVAWLRRHRIGFVPAYVLTVIDVLFRPVRFGEEVWHIGEIADSEAQAFWTLTVVIATASAALALAPMAQGLSHDPLHLAGFLLTVTIATAVFFLIATLRLQIDPPLAAKGAKQRFARLQHFGCAGLALAPFVPITEAAVAWGRAARKLPETLGEMLIALSVAIVLAAWIWGGAAFHYFGGLLELGGTLRYLCLLACLWMMAALAAGAVAFGLMMAFA